MKFRLTADFDIDAKDMKPGDKRQIINALQSVIRHTLERGYGVGYVTVQMERTDQGPILRELGEPDAYKLDN